MEAPLPPDEQGRLEALRLYEILDTEPEQEFDDISLLAAHVCGTPIASISLLDENRQWFKSKVGMKGSETTRDVAFCAHGILQPGVFVVNDARADDRFSGNTLVTRRPGIRFFAGAPLITPEGHAVGMLSVIDQVPGELSEAQKLALEALGRQVIHLLESRRSLAELHRTMARLKGVKEELKWRTAFFEALANSSIDGFLVVDDMGKKIFQNQRLVDLMKIPAHVAENDDDGQQLDWVAGLIKYPAQFLEKIVYLKSNKDETSRDEIELTDGAMLDRYSAPVVGRDGKYYGRIWTFRDITGRKETENALLKSNEKFQQLAENITDAFWIRSPDMSEVQYVSPAFERIWGRSIASLYANPHEWVNFIMPEDRERVVAAFAALAGDAPNLDIEYRIVRPDGVIRWIRVRGFQVRDAANELIRHTGIVTDITERKRLEAHLFQAQKMETVGKLAGGVAHEFNSILTAIIGQGELMLTDLPPGNPLCKNAMEILKAAERATALTRQLLAYGRKQILQPEVLDLNSILAGVESALRHLMGRNCDVRIAPAAGLEAVQADAGQIEQVIMNMAMNAADAMPNGGHLTLETANVTLDEGCVGSFPELKPGDYVMLAITDTGTGMDAEVKSRVFEPFYSTKGTGEGTGLGLSTSYGIIKQSGGHISVYSEPSRGTTFKIFLPQVGRQAKIPVQRLDSPNLPRGTETILLVEDDPALREMAATLLGRLGYKVLAAANGIEALDLKQQRDSGDIDLLFTDVVMPRMSGKELADRIRALHPLTKILFTSAYTENAIVHQGVLEKGVALLQKPFTPSALARKLREVLEEKAERHPALHVSSIIPEPNPEDMHLG